MQMCCYSGRVYDWNSITCLRGACSVFKVCMSLFWYMLATCFLVLHTYFLEDTSWVAFVWYWAWQVDSYSHLTLLALYISVCMALFHWSKRQRVYWHWFQWVRDISCHVNVWWMFGDGPIGCNWCQLSYGMT